ncbi:MFS transporter [Dyella sp.]|uniref:MFS transporter n=1 Tax=Dyella sp. TaxID=1869338 RepID=UPI002ED30A38
MNRILVVASLGLSYMIYAVLLNSVGTVILQSILSFGIAKQTGSVLEACKDLSIAAVSFLAASQLPRFGYRRAMIMAHALVGLACMAMATMPSFLTTKLLFVVIGVTFALVKVSVYSSIGLLTATRQQHASLMNVIEGLFMLGVLCGYWLFGAYIDPHDPGRLSWTQVYWIPAAASALVIGMLLITRLDERAMKGSVVQRSGGAFVEMLRLLMRPLVYAFILSIFMYVLIEQSLGTWLPTFNREILHLPPAMSVQVASIYAASLALGRLLAGYLLRRVSWYALLNACVVAMAVLVVVTMPLAARVELRPDVNWLNAPPVAYALPLIGLLMAPIYPVVNSVMLSALPVERHASMTGLIVVFSALGGTLGSFITGLVFSHIGGDRAFYMTLAPMAAILMALFVFRREARIVAPGAPVVADVTS